MIGDAGVGKTYLVKKFLNPSNSKNFEKPGPTVFIEYEEKIVELKNKKIVKIELWDTGK